MATASKVMMPDGSEQDAADVICEDCNKPVSQHTCVNGTSGGTATTVVTSRSTGPRKDPKARPLCPHCNGAIHFSMPGGLQNTECIMRQYYLDGGLIADPFARLPIFGLDDLEKALTWAKDLKTPLTYGRMDSAAGAAGTYAAHRPKADPAAKEGKRARKQKAAEKGEKIEDIAATVVADPTSTAPQPVSAGALSREERRQRMRQRRAGPVNGTTPVPTVPVEAAPVAPAEPEMSVEERKAARRAALLGRR